MSTNKHSLLSHPGIPWLLLFLWLAPPLAARLLTGDWGKAGTVGDTFGIANTLFSGIALLGLVVNMQSARLEAEERERRYALEQTALREQTIQLALATRLDSTRALIATHRSALMELNPAIRSVPTSPKLLSDLRASIKRDAIAKVIAEQTAIEIEEHLNELEQLQKEVTVIRSHLERIYASTSPSAEVSNGQA